MENKEFVVKKKRKLPTWLKAVLIKFWFAGAVYFFVGWGLFLNTTDQLDLALVIGLVLGTITDLMVNRIFHGMEHVGNEYSIFMMFPKKNFASFLLNVLYGIILSFIVAYTYHFINAAIIQIKYLPETSVVLGAEPILFGVFCMSYDMLFLLVKRLFKKEAQKNEN
ncbi:MAG: hypothetical protein AB1Z23_08395 [Eubacteriales bacterium]